MKDIYFKILGLPANASEEQIKKAYRSLAMKYHPDKNQNTDAHKLFIKINEAYAALTNEEKDYEDQSSENIKRKYKRAYTDEEFAKKMEWARNYARMKDIKESRINKIGYIQLRKSYMNWLSVYVSIFSILVSTLFVLDYWLLPYNQQNGLVASKSYSEFLDAIELTISPANDQFEVLEEQFIFSVHIDELNFIKVHLSDSVIYYKTFLLGQKVLLKNKSDQNDQRLFNINSFYRIILLFIIIFYLPIITLVSKGPNTIHILASYIITYFVLFAMFILIISILSM